MRNFFITLLFISILTSCSKDSVSKPVGISLKSEEYDNLDGIPFHIVLFDPVNSEQKYLSIKDDNTKLDLSSNKNNDRQVWFLDQKEDGYLIRSAYGVSEFNNKSLKTDAGGWAFLADNMAPGYSRWNLQSLYEGSEFVKIYPVGAPEYFTLYAFYNPNGVYIITNQLTTNDKHIAWKLEPIGEFEFKSITYSLAEEDIPQKLSGDPIVRYLNNNSSVEQSQNFAIKTTIKETSTFKRTTKAGLQIKSKFSVGVPLIGEAGINVNASVSNEWQYGTTSSKETEKSYSFPVKIPAHTHLRVKAVFVPIKGSANYEAIFVDTNTGRELKIRGRWEGIQCEDNLTYDIDEVDNNGNVIKNFKGTLKKGATLDLTY